MTHQRVSHLSDNRQIANAINQTLDAVEGYPFPQLAAAPASPRESCTYYDLTLHKVRTWDGTVWNNHW